MPNITIEGPPVSVEVKRRLVEDMTATASDAYGIPAEAIVVVIKENPRENVGVGGCLLCDRHAEGQITT